MNIRILYESLKDLIGIIINQREGKTKMIASIFALTLIISAVGFILTNIAILPTKAA